MACRHTHLDVCVLVEHPRVGKQQLAVPLLHVPRGLHAVRLGRGGVHASDQLVGIPADCKRIVPACTCRKETSVTFA